jgi:uncharacterized membrane protein YqjE
MSARDVSGDGGRTTADDTIETRGPGGVRPDAAAGGRAGRETQEIVRSILDDTQSLFEKHVELARQELVEAVEARIQALMAGALAGVAALFALGFLASAGAHALDLVMPAWGSRLVVAAVFLLVVAVGALVGRQRMSHPPFAPEATKDALKEDAEWARARLRR